MSGRRTILPPVPVPAPPKEDAIVTAIIRRLKREPCLWYVKNHGTPFGRRGIPDITGCYRGRMFGLEVKRPGRKHDVSKLQELELQRIANAGGLAAVVESVDDAMAVLCLV